jgi:hypothetical protein
LHVHHDSETDEMQQKANFEMGNLYLVM